MERIKKEIKMVTRRMPTLFDDWINDEIFDDGLVYFKGYYKFYERNYKSVIYEIKDLESGLDPDKRDK